MDETKIFAVKKISKDRAEMLMYKYIGGGGVNSNDFVSQLKALEKQYKFIDLRINSGGGDVFEGIAMYNAVKNSQAVIDTYCEGIAGSMASILFQAGRTRYISRYGQVMTHKPSGVGIGNSERLREVAGRIDTLENTMANIYAERTGKTEDECKTRYMNGRDNWFIAEAAISEGLADAIYDGQSRNVVIPINITSEQDAYERYAAQLDTPFYKTQQNTMSEITLSAEQLAQMGLTGSVTIEKVMSNYTAMAEAAAKVPTLEASLRQAQTDKEKAENDFAAYKTESTAEKIKALCDKAVEEGRMSVNQRVKLEAKYGDDYDGLKELVDTMQPQKTIVNQLTGDASEEVKKLMAQTGEELFKNGGFERLKDINEDAYNWKWTEYTK